MLENKIKNLYILGNHIQALGLSRIGSEAGLTITLFNDYNFSVTRFSNTCKHFVKFSSYQALLHILLKKSDPESKNTIIVPTNDSLVWFLREHYYELNELYYLGVPDPRVIEICYNKRKTYQKAAEVNIPIPLSYFPDSEKELIKIKNTITYPVIIKPAIMHTFFKITGKKALKCENEIELLKSYKEIINIIPADEVIIQKFIAGGAINLFSFGAFAVEGNVWGGFVANRIRQKPMDFGISTTFAKTVFKPEIAILGSKILKELNFSGMAEVEFMYDVTSDSYKLLEINPRSWKWHSITNKLNLNFIKMMISFFNNESIEPTINNNEDIAWIERLTDTFIALKELTKGKLNLKDYLKSLKLNKESAVWSWKDPLPGIMYILLSPYLLIKRN